jgi:DNA repair exonuclease SbcCD ATPase subunit
VITLLEGLKAKAIAQGKDEEVAYSKFQYWCSTSISELKDAIAEEKEKIEELEDQLAGLNKQKESLEKEIETLEDQIGELEAAAKKAKDNRAAEAKLYDKANKDLTSTIKAVDDCIKALEGAQSTTESMMLAQRHVKMVLALVSMKVTDQQLKVLQSFAAPKDRPDQLASGDLNKHVDKYDFKSENVIELLKQLKLKFEDDKIAGTEAETNAVNAYELAKEARDNAVDAAKESKAKKEKELAGTKKAIAEAEAELKSTQSDLKDDSKSHADTEDACSTKKSEWETRSETRKLEIEAMDQAMKILAKSSGVRTEAPGNPVPPPSPLDFLQVHSSATDPKMKAVALLKETAQETNSRALERLAVAVAAHLSGPFDEVNNMIEKMIFRLMDEQKQEDEHKLWCDQEIKKTETMRDNKKDKIEDLKAEIKVETAAVGKLTEEIADAEKMISDIVTFMKEATEIRETGKTENKLAIKDAKDAQTSLTNAIAVLEAFYKESGEIPKEPWEFIQKPVNLGKKPSTWDASYSGVADPDKKNTGIISILEAVLSDFSKMEAETKSQEAQDQKEYDEEMSANEIEKADRTQEVEMKTAEKKRRADKIASLSGQKKNTEGELEKTEQYLVDLKPACVDGDSSYEDRKASRTKEIEALKKAQVILLDAFKEKDNTKFLQIRSHSRVA